MPQKLLERRTVTGEVEARAKGSEMWVEGYAAVFEKRSGNLGGFVEKVRNTAFTKTVKEADVRALWNHDPQYVLGRSGAGTLQLSVDTNGLYYRSLLPNTSYARDLAELLERRDVRESSFTFFKVKDAWELAYDIEGFESEGYPQRSLVEVGLIDVAPVTFPAYEDATSGVARRAAFDGLAKRCGIDGCEIESKLDTEEAIRKAIQGLEPDSSTKDEPRSTQTLPENDSTQHDSNLSKNLRADIELMKLKIEEFESFFKKG